MILAKDRIELEKKEKKETEITLESKIQRGKSAERLSFNSDWINLTDTLKASLEHNDLVKISLYDSITQDSVTMDQKLQAIDRVRQISYSVESMRYLINLPKMWAEEGAQAEVELKKIQGEGESK